MICESTRGVSKTYFKNVFFTLQIPDDMGDPMTPPCNTKMHDGGCSCKVNNEEGKVKMSCGMESRNAY